MAEKNMAETNQTSHRQNGRNKTLMSELDKKTFGSSVRAGTSGANRQVKNGSLDLSPKAEKLAFAEAKTSPQKLNHNKST